MWYTKDFLMLITPNLAALYKSIKIPFSETFSKRANTQQGEKSFYINKALTGSQPVKKVQADINLN